jgi:hypothetical protein
MSEPIMLEATLYGGPVDGAQVRAPETSGYLLAAVGREVHGYAWGHATERGRWIYRHQGLLARTGPGTRAAEVLRKKGHAVAELVADVEGGDPS